jgi:hypothetical protein
VPPLRFLRKRFLRKQDDNAYRQPLIQAPLNGARWPSALERIRHRSWLSMTSFRYCLRTTLLLTPSLRECFHQALVHMVRIARSASSIFSNDDQLRAHVTCESIKLR